MNNLLQRDGESSPLAKALEDHFGSTSHKDMDNLISLTSQEIDDLEYEEQVPDPSDSTKTIATMTSLNKGDRGILHILQNFYIWMQNKNEDISPDKWVDISYDDFRCYRLDHNLSMLNKRANLGVPGVASSAGFSRPCRTIT